MSETTNALERAVSALGGQTAFAAALSKAAGRLVTQQHIWNWLNRSGVLPAEFVLPAEAASGVSRHDLRPDIYPAEAA